jgi:SRR1
MHKIGCIHMLGLGSPSQSPTARCQLALLPTLLVLTNKDAAVTAYDPVSTPSDAAILEACGVRALSEAEASKHHGSGCTLLYMPHCETALYNNVLDERWSVEELSGMVILGNSFGAILVRMPHLSYCKLSKLEMCAAHSSATLLQLQSRVQERCTGPSSRRVLMKPHRVIALAEHGLVEEHALAGTGFRLPHVFNDTSLHCFPTDKLRAAAQPLLVGLMQPAAECLLAVDGCSSAMTARSCSYA